MLLQEKIESIKMTEHQTQSLLSTKESADSHEESDSNEDSIDKDDVFNDPDEELEVVKDSVNQNMTTEILLRMNLKILNLEPTKPAQVCIAFQKTKQKSNS